MNTTNANREVKVTSVEFNENDTLDFGTLWHVVDGLVSKGAFFNHKDTDEIESTLEYLTHCGAVDVPDVLSEELEDDEDQSYQFLIYQEDGQTGGKMYLFDDIFGNILLTVNYSFK